MQLGKLGVWAAMDTMTAAEGAAFAQRVEAWGYAALWLPESRGRNVMVHSSWLLANTTKLIVAPGIANIYARDPMATVNAQKALAEQSGGRFLLGLGVSHVPSVEGLRGHTYGRPIATMRNYLDAMKASPYGAPEPAEKPLTILAALGPRMLELSSTHADGAHPYNVTPEHTAEARRIMGPGKLLCPEVWVLLETDPTKARALGRTALANYLRLDNYLNNWRRLGFSEDDLANGGSDRLVDATVLWGTADTIRKRIQEHWDAGADHVCIQSISPDGSRRPDEKVLELLAPSRKS